MPESSDEPIEGADARPEEVVPETPSPAGPWHRIRALVPGPDASVRRRAAFRGAIAGSVVLLLGLPLAILLPSDDEITAPAGMAPSDPKKEACANQGAGDPVIAPNVGAAGEAFAVFGPTLRDRGGSLVPARSIEVWLNATAPDPDAESLGSGPVELLADETIGRSCSFVLWPEIPEVRRDTYVISVFALTPRAKGGFEQLGAAEIEVVSERAGVRNADVSTFVEAFLAARIDGFDGAARGLVAPDGAAAFDPEKGSLAPLVDPAYRRGKVTSTREIDDDVFEVEVEITRDDAAPVRETYLAGPGENDRGDALRLLILGES